MGARGPAPTPHKLLALRGSWRAEHSRDTVQAPPQIPEPPSWLGAEARPIWDKVTAQLGALGLLAAVDEMPLARYCEMMVRWIKAKEFVDKHGDSHPVLGKRDRVIGMKLVPQMKILKEFGAELRSLEAQFGMTPAARTRIISPEKAASAGYGDTSKSRFFA